MVFRKFQNTTYESDHELAMYLHFNLQVYVKHLFEMQYIWFLLSSMVIQDAQTNI